MIIQFFPKVLYLETLKSLDKSTIKYLKEKMVKDSVIAGAQTNGELTKDQQILKDNKLANLNKEILLHIKKYVDILGHEISSVKVCSSWGNILRKGEHIHAHKHTNAYISGCFYLTDGCNILFHNSSADKDFMFNPIVTAVEDKPWTWSNMTIPAEVGRILLFPSQLSHSVEDNPALDDRYSLAFNVIPQGTFGARTFQLTL